MRKQMEICGSKCKIAALEKTMKNIFKILASCTLCAAIAVFGSGCVINLPANSGNNNPPIDNTDDNGDNGDNGGNGGDDTFDGNVYAVKMFDQLEAAKSFSVNLAAEKTVTTVEGAVTEYKLDVSADCNLTEEGFDFALTVNSCEKEEGAEEWTENEPVHIYYIADVWYYYDEFEEGYIADDTFTENIVAMVEYILELNGVPVEAIKGILPIVTEQIGSLDDIDLSDVKAALGDEITEKAVVEEGKVELSAEKDLADELNQAIETINEIDEETVTLEAALNDYLLSSLELDCETVVNLVAYLGDMSFDNIVMFVDMMLKSNDVALTVDELWSEIIGSQMAEALLTQLVGEEAFAELAEMDVDALMEISVGDKTLGETTPYELICSLVNSGEDSEIVLPETATELGEAALEYLQTTTLAEAGITLPALDAYVVSSANINGMISFDESTYAMEVIGCGLSAVILETDVAETSVTATVQVFNVSDQSIEITAPETVPAE